MNEDRKPRHATDTGPPTLPLPSAWRLIVAAAAIIGVLYMMYESARDAEEPLTPAPTSPSVGGGSR
ncbi:MAG: hypothetical protein IPK78_09645 [Rhodospirillales bacterium]|nr:hypothetical protein [Rhodospirillales bacterium]